MRLLEFVFLFFFCIVLVKATDLLISSLKALSKVTQIGKLALTGIIIGLATSLPELFIGVVSALEGRPEISLGNIIGSNIVDLSLVAGGAALLGGVVAIRRKIFSSEMLLTFFLSTFPFILFWDKVLSRTDGLILLVLYLFYCFVLVKDKKRGQDEDWFKKILHRLSVSVDSHKKLWARFFLGLILLLFSAEMIVRLGVSISSFLNSSAFLTSLFFIAIGTSLPELIFELETIRKKEGEMFLGNLLGSVVANSLLVLGLTSLISPIAIMNYNNYLLPLIFFVLIYFLFWVLIKTKKELTRREGFTLVLIYLFFVLLSIWGNF